MREWLYDLRKGQGMTLKEAGEKLGISESYYKNIEDGKRQTKMDMLFILNISKVFNVPVTQIVQNEKVLIEGGKL